MVMKKLAVPFVLLAGGLWGMIGLFVRHFTALGLAALDIAELRIATALAVAGLYLLIFHRGGFRVRLRDLWIFLGSGVVSLLMFSVCYYSAMRYVSLSVASVLLYTAPIFVMLLSAALFREKITPVKLIALALAFGGCVCVSGIGSGAPIPSVGLLLGLGAGLFYALYSIFGRYAFLRGYDSWTLLFYTFLFCAAGCAFFADWRAIVVAAAEPSFLPWTLAFGVTTGFLAYLFYSLGLERMESGRASILASFEPLVATLVGVIAFKEALTPLGVAGILLILGAVALLNRPARRAS